MKKELWVNEIFWKEEEVTWKDIKNRYLVRVAVNLSIDTTITNSKIPDDPHRIVMRQVIFEYDRDRDIFILNDPEIYLNLVSPKVLNQLYFEEKKKV